MALPAFDTLKFADELEESGVPEKQARAISLGVFKSHGSLDVATKADLDKLGTELRHEISDLRKDMAAMEERSDAKHESLRKDMDAKHESLRKDNELLRKDMDARFELMNARFEKLLLRTAVVLGVLGLVGPNLGPLLSLFR